MPNVEREAPDEEHTQSVVFEKSADTPKSTGCFAESADWTEASSKKWCEEHDYFTDGMDENKTQFRYRQYDPDYEKFVYRNQEIETDSITLVLGIPKEEAKDMIKKHEPIRCFEGNTKPHEPFWFWNAVVEEGVSEPELELNGYISEYSWFEDDITPKMFKDELYRYGKGGPITIRMNSYGGDVIAASLMSSMIRDYPGRVTVQIDGIAASAATVVAVAGDTIKMQETAYFMIHDPLAVFFLAMLNIEDLSRMVDSLKTVKEGIINAYETKSGLSRARISKLMTEETWMDAQKAVDLGFVDEVVKGNSKKITIPVENAAVVNALRIFVNVPKELIERERGASITPQQNVNVPEPLKALLEPETEPVNSVPEEEPKQPPKMGTNKAADRLRAESKILKEKKI
jgi:ATP-dependent Clp protease protease subunit